MTTPCKIISRDSQGVHCCSSEPCDVSATDMWVSQLCIKKVLSHFSQKKKKTVLSMVTYQSLTASATLLAFGSPSSTHGSYILSYRIQRKIPEILKGIRSLQTFVFFNMLQL